MSKKTNIGKKPIVKDFGIQPYRKCDKDYPEVIRTPTFKAANDATVVRESEFAKPYDESEDYSGMEYAAPNWPGTDWPGMDYPDMGLPVPDFPNMYDPWKIYFRCNVDPCWCEGDTKTFAANCTYEIVKVKFFPPESDLSVAWTKNTISITALSGIRDNESGYLTITMKANVPKGGTLWQGKYDPVYGSHGGISVKECDDCCDDSGMAWDSDASAETVAQNNSCAVAITDSLGIGGPYSWSVSGTGFSLSSAQTTGLSNTLNAGGSACGAATITVTGCGGAVVTGYVRCTTGHWGDLEVIGSNCTACPANSCSPGLISGESLLDYATICRANWLFECDACCDVNCSSIGTASKASDDCNSPYYCFDTMQEWYKWIC